MKTMLSMAVASVAALLALDLVSTQMTAYSQDMNDRWSPENEQVELKLKLKRNWQKLKRNWQKLKRNWQKLKRNWQKLKRNWQMDCRACPISSFPALTNRISQNTAHLEEECF